jgi:hypothetical protein
MHALLIPFIGVMTERDVELRLDTGVGRAIPLGEAEQRLVARVVAEGIRHRVVSREVDADCTEPLEELGVIRAEQVLKVYLVRIGSPIEEEVKQVPAASPERVVKGAARLDRQIVPVAEEEQDQCVVLALERDLECRGRVPSWPRRILRHLKGPSCLNPALHVVEPALPTEAMEFDKVLHIRSGPRRRVDSRRVRVGSRIYICFAEASGHGSDPRPVAPRGYGRERNQRTTGGNPTPCPRLPRSSTVEFSRLQQSCFGAVPGTVSQKSQC